MSDLDRLAEAVEADSPFGDGRAADAVLSLAPELIAVARYASSIDCETCGEFYRCCGEVSGDPHMDDCPVPALLAKLAEVLGDV